MVLPRFSVGPDPSGGDIVKAAGAALNQVK
jgi:hypothetical protein